jgi:hypothetical protein
MKRCHIAESTSWPPGLEDNIAYPLRCDNTRTSVIKYTAKIIANQSLRLGSKGYDLLKKIASTRTGQCVCCRSATDMSSVDAAWEAVRIFAQSLDMENFTCEWIG